MQRGRALSNWVSDSPPGIVKPKVQYYFEIPPLHPKNRFSSAAGSDVANAAGSGIKVVRGLLPTLPLLNSGPAKPSYVRVDGNPTGTLKFGFPTLELILGDSPTLEGNSS